jgi:hypothetical protein
MPLVQCPACNTILDATRLVCPGCGGCWRCLRKTEADPEAPCPRCDLPYCPCCGRCPTCGEARYADITSPCDCDPSEPPPAELVVDASGRKEPATWSWPEDHPGSRGAGCGSAVLWFVLAAVVGLALVV